MLKPRQLRHHPVDFLQGQLQAETKRRGEKQQANLSNKKKTMNVTEILDNIKETYKSWACCQGEVQKECEKQLFVDLPVQ